MSLEGFGRRGMEGRRRSIEEEGVWEGERPFKKKTPFDERRKALEENFKVKVFKSIGAGIAMRARMLGSLNQGQTSSSQKDDDVAASIVEDKWYKEIVDKLKMTRYGLGGETLHNEAGKIFQEIFPDRYERYMTKLRSQEKPADSNE